MGNDLAGQNQSGQVINSLLNKLSNNPQILPIRQPQSPNKPLVNLRNNKFFRGDEQLPTIFENSPNQQQQQYLEQSQNPTYQLQSSNSRIISPNKPYIQSSRVVQYPPSTLSQNQTSPFKTNNNINGSMVADPRGSRINRVYSSPAKRQQKVQSPKPFNFFNTFFGGQRSQTQKKLRSSSASHFSNSDKKYALLQSSLKVAQVNYQNSQRKVQDLTKTLQSIQNNLRTTQQSKASAQYSKQQLQSSLKSTQSRIQYLQSQLQSLSQQLQKTRQSVNQKQVQIGSLQSQMYSMRNQQQLQQARINQYNQREQKKDKEIMELASAKFQLNSLKIRLENNIKILQDQEKDKTRSIQELEANLDRKNKEIQAVKGQRMGLQEDLVAMRAEIQRNFHKNQQQKNILNSNIRGNLLTIDQNQQKILDLTTKIDKYYQNQLQNQQQISQLQSDLKQHIQQIHVLKQHKQNKQHQYQLLQQEYSKLQQHNKTCEQQVGKHREIGQRILNDYNNARKVGQKQIQFLENKVQELSKEKERLVEEIQITKSVAVQRNKVFQRSIIYQLKEENDKLWSKLIEKSNKQADYDADDQNYWKNKIQQRKNQLKKQKMDNQPIQIQINGKNQLQTRFDNFIRQLTNNSNHNDGILNNNNIKNVNNSISYNQYQENIQFYRQKCNQLQKMVQTHIVVNKNLKSQIDKYTNYESALRNFDSQVQNLKNEVSKLTAQNIKLREGKPQLQSDNKKSQQRVKQLQNQNKKYFQDLVKLRNDLQNSRNQARRHLEDITRLNTQINVYKKWQGLYDQIKSKYDNLLNNSKGKQDYKQMYEDLQKQQQRLKGLYQLKQSDYEKLSRTSNQKIDYYQKQLKSLQQASEYLRRELQLKDNKPNQAKAQDQFKFNH